MATSQETVEEYLECAICLVKFVDPKVLSCQHIYCKRCLEKLVTRVRRRYVIRCPECREKSEVRDGDVSKLPSNYLINRLLLLKRFNSKPSCKKHEGEILKLFCKSCDHLICRDCTIADHRDHQYSFIKDIFPAENEEILQVLEESKTNILTLKNYIDTLKEQEESLNENFDETDQKIDDFVEKQIKLLKRKKRSMKDQLQKSFSTQKDEIHSEMEYFIASLDYAKNRVEVTESILDKVTQADILAAKKEMIKHLTDINTAIPFLTPSPRLTYKFNVDPSLDEDITAIGEIATLSVE